MSIESEIMAKQLANAPFQDAGREYLIAPPEPARVTYPYSVLGVVAGRLATLRSFWADSDHAARLLAGELTPGTVLVRDVERASPGQGGRL